MMTDEALQMAKRVIGAAFFGRADYEPEHQDIIISQTYGGLVHTLAAHLAALPDHETKGQPKENA